MTVSIKHLKSDILSNYPPMLLNCCLTSKLGLQIGQIALVMETLDKTHGKSLRLQTKINYFAYFFLREQSFHLFFFKEKKNDVYKNKIL